MRSSSNNNTKKIVSHSLLVVLLGLYCLPLYLVMTNAFKSYEHIIKNPLGLPLQPTIMNFVRAMKEADIMSLYKNSFVITISSLIVIVIISSMLGYIFARRKGRIIKVLYIMVLMGMMIPVQNVLIPSIRTLKFLHLLGTFPGLILFYAGTYLPMATFLFTEFIKTIPVSMDEAAMIDGASQFRTFFQIIFPLLKNCSVTVIIFIGMWIWNDFLPPMYILGSGRGKTITTGIYNAIGTFTTDWSLVFACVYLASLPILILYIVLQKQFQKGMTAGSAK